MFKVADLIEFAYAVLIISFGIALVIVAAFGIGGLS